MVFIKGSAPERAVSRLRRGDRLHVYGLPRVSFAEISRRIQAAGLPEHLSRARSPTRWSFSGSFLRTGMTGVRCEAAAASPFRACRQPARITSKGATCGESAGSGVMILVAATVAVGARAQDKKKPVSFLGDIGFVNTAGNTHLTTLNLGDKLSVRAGKVLLTQSFALVYGKSEGIQNANSQLARIRADYSAGRAALGVRVHRLRAEPVCRDRPPYRRGSRPGGGAAARVR